MNIRYFVNTQTWTRQRQTNCFFSVESGISFSWGFLCSPPKIKSVFVLVRQVNNVHNCKHYLLAGRAVKQITSPVNLLLHKWFSGFLWARHLWVEKLSMFYRTDCWQLPSSLMFSGSTESETRPEPNEIKLRILHDKCAFNNISISIDNTMDSLCVLSLTYFLPIAA